MPFKSLLTQLVESIPGATGAILADWEGEAVEHFCLSGDDYELKIIGAHKGIILNRLKELEQALAGGEPREVVISTSDRHIIAGTIGPEYELVLTLERHALIGKALYEFNKTAHLLYREIY